MTTRKFMGSIVLAAAACMPGVSSNAQDAEQPNVILVITDDQGYGDIACHGNDVIKTSSLDKLWSQSTRLTNYHVAPTCSPTRCALMTASNIPSRWPVVG